MTAARTQPYTVAEVARYMRVSPMTVYRLIDRGELKAARFGRTIRIFPAQLTEWFDSLREES